MKIELDGKELSYPWVRVILFVAFFFAWNYLIFFWVTKPIADYGFEVVTGKSVEQALIDKMEKDQ